jgi:hypothetical protein
LNRLREELFQYHAVSVAGFVFQACSFNHSDISPRLESISYERSNKDYRTRRRFPAGLPPSPFLSAAYTARARASAGNCVRPANLARSLTATGYSVAPVGRPTRPAIRVLFRDIQETRARLSRSIRRSTGGVLASFRRDAHPLRLPSSIGTRGVFIGELLSEKEDDGRGGCHVLSPMAIQAAVWLEQTVPDRPPDGSTLLGYDLADASLISGLSN